MRALIQVNPGLAGLFAGIANELSKKNEVIILTRDAFLKRQLNEIIPSFKGEIDIYNETIRKSDKNKLIKKCMQFELIYDEKISFIMGYDRGLCRCYIYNADKYPNRKEASWSYYKKLNYMINKIEYYENIVKKYNPDIVISLRSNMIFSIILRKNNIPYLHLYPSKYGDRYFWGEDDFLTSKDLIQAIKQNINTDYYNLNDIPNYREMAVATHRFDKTKYNILSVFKRLIKRIISDLYGIYIGTEGIKKEYGYYLFGWVGPILRSYMMYRYFCKYGMKLSQLKNIRFVYYPFPLEPEIALLNVSPEFHSSIELLTWISKSLPVNTYIVVKEHPLSFGIRSKEYYDRLRQFPNVFLSHPDNHSFDLIKISKIVAVITGSVGIEAVNYNKPVLSFGKHQIINYLPTVCYASNYMETKEGIKKLFNLRENDIFDKSCYVMRKSQLECSFGLPGLEKQYTIEKPYIDDKLVKICLEKIEKYMDIKN